MEFSNSGGITLKTVGYAAIIKSDTQLGLSFFRVLTRRPVRPVLYNDDVPLSAGCVLIGADRGCGEGGRGGEGGGGESTTE